MHPYRTLALPTTSPKRYSWFEKMMARLIGGEWQWARKVMGGHWEHDWLNWRQGWEKKEHCHKKMLHENYKRLCPSPPTVDWSFFIRYEDYEEEQ